MAAVSSSLRRPRRAIITPDAHPLTATRLMAAGRGRPLLAEVVRTELKRAILGGEFAVGSKLPNEDRLCERFGVSRVTIREAVRGLIEDGLVIRKHGSGTYVTRRPLLQNSLDTNFSYTEYIEASGLRAGRKLIGTRTIAAAEDLATVLAISVGAPVVEVRRLRTADRRPAIYSVDLVPAEFVPRGVSRDELAGSLYRILTTADHPIAHAEAVLSPTIADRELAGLLDVVPGTPLQFLHQIDFDESGRAVMVSDEWHVPSVMELRVYRRGPGPVA